MGFHYSYGEIMSDLLQVITYYYEFGVNEMQQSGLVWLRLWSKSASQIKTSDTLVVIQTKPTVARHWILILPVESQGWPRRRMLVMLSALYHLVTHTSIVTRDSCVSPRLPPEREFRILMTQINARSPGFVLHLWIWVPHVRRWLQLDDIERILKYTNWSKMNKKL